jgi:hypothetical protein
MESDLMKKIIFIILIMPIIALAQFQDYIVDEFRTTHKTLAGGMFSMIEQGAGIGVFYELPYSNFWHIGGRIDGFMLRDSKQIEYYDYYGNPRIRNKLNNAFLIDLIITAKKRLLTDNLDDSIRPYINFGGGIVTGMNFPEYNIDPIEGVPTGNQYDLTYTILGGIGVDATISPNSYFGITLEYRYMKFNEKIGETNNYSTIGIRLEIGKRF